MVSSAWASVFRAERPRFPNCHHLPHCTPFFFYGRSASGLPWPTLKGHPNPRPTLPNRRLVRWTWTSRRRLPPPLRPRKPPFLFPLRPSPTRRAPHPNQRLLMLRKMRSRQPLLGPQEASPLVAMTGMSRVRLSC